jgi:hypothetical protein
MDTKTLFDVAIVDMSEKLCELLGIACTPAVLAHWDTPEGKAALDALRPQLHLLAARALTINAAPVTLATSQITDKGAPSFLRAALDQQSVSPAPANPKASPESSGLPPKAQSGVRS